MRSIAALLILALATATTSSISAAPSDDPEHLVFGSGKWSMKFSYNGALVGFGGAGTATGTGTGQLDLVEGVLNGAWEFSATADFSIAGLRRKQTLSYNGGFTGPPSRPIMDPQQNPGTSLTMYIYSATCTQVIGKFSPDAEAIAEAAGFSALFNASFVAYRKTTVGIEDYEEQVEALLTEAQKLANQAMQGFVDDAGLQAVVLKAETLAATVKKAEKCNTLNDADDFNLALSQIIADLLVHVANTVGIYTPDQVFDLLLLGVRVGAIGQGAVDQQFSNSLIDQFEANFQGMLDLAIAANNQEQIQVIYTTAQFMGWTTLAQKAAAAQ